ncbi:MAG: glycosyltransferase family 4 protein [Verrucomicrobia bacterium]|nr:glycosyltransferase family 4 protein [Verrucomicrobiota bacterium]
MRLGIIKNNFFPAGGGSERYTSGLIAELRRRGAAVDVFASRWSADAAAAGVAVHPVRVPRAPAFLRQLMFALACRRAVAASACDIVFSLERTASQDIVRAGGGCHIEWLRQRARRASVLHRLRLRVNPLHRAHCWLERRTYSVAHTGAIIANSHRGKEEIVRHYGFPADRIFVVHNGTDGEQFRPAAGRAERGETVLLLAGSGFERKGVEFAVRALARLPASVRLEVAGKGRAGPYRRLAARLGVAERLRFLGSVPRMAEVYANADILVHPALYEPFSNACLEAMASGLPVVTSRINGASEIVRPGGNGNIIEDPADIEALARAIRPFLDPTVRARAGAAARRTAESMPMTLNVEQTLAVIETCRAHPDWAVWRARP